MNEENPAQQIRARIVNGFAINRIPEKTKARFLQLATEEFCDDRGMLLKYLIDIHDGIVVSGIEHVESALNEFNERLLKLENKPVKKEEPKVRRMMDGTRIEEKQNE